MSNGESVDKAMTPELLMNKSLKAEKTYQPSNDSFLEVPASH